MKKSAALLLTATLLLPACLPAAPALAATPRAKGGSSVTVAKGGNVRIERPATGEAAAVKVDPARGDRPARLEPGDVVTVAEGGAPAEVIVQGEDGNPHIVRVKPGTSMTVPDASKKKQKKGILDRIREKVRGERNWEQPETPQAVTGVRG